jgi:predicted secreted hydrolase
LYGKKLTERLVSNRIKKIITQGGRRMKKWTSFLVCLVFILAGCAVKKNLRIPFDDTAHQDTFYEWSPHVKAHEWWYLTGYMTGENDELYFYQFTLFHGYGGPFQILEGYALHLSFTDCQSGEHLFFEDINKVSNSIYGDSQCTTFEDNSICVDQDNIVIQANSDKLRFLMKCDLTKNPAWHGTNGVIIMGHPQIPEERSYYFSYTNMKTKGTIEYINKENKRSVITGKGKSWFDKQWGVFNELGWEWLSFRFFDNEEVMLFSFPKTGHKEGTYVNAAGESVVFSDYDYTVDKWVDFNDKKIGLGWEVQIPYKEKKYHVIPVVEDQFNPSVINNYWEGICKIFNGENQLVGYCVIETTGRAY